MNPVRRYETRPLSPIPEENTQKPKILSPIAKRLVQYRNIESMIEERLEEEVARIETIILVDVTFRYVIRVAQENKDEGKK